MIHIASFKESVLPTDYQSNTSGADRADSSKTVETG
jgi:hypothetical protein